MSLIDILNIERPQGKFRPHCTYEIKDISTLELPVNRKFRQRLQSRSEQHNQ